MTKNKKITQIILLLVGFMLIFGTYFYYPKLNKIVMIEKEPITTNEQSDKEKVQSNIFENVEYKGLYNVENSFSIKAEKAHILAGKPEIVYMNKMKATIYMNDGRIIIVTSDNGRYNKISNDCFFENNVKATDSRIIILSKNLDLLASEDFASIYNNVSLINDRGSLFADKIDYNFKTKFYKISMFNDESVKVKLIN